MKKRDLTSLKLNKKSISNFNLFGGVKATCQSPCQGGTSCCSLNGVACEENGDGDGIKIPATSLTTLKSFKPFC